jgi:2-haloacid dehalogenase
MTTAPSVLVFDVNETLVDIDSMTPLFARIFGDPRALREWFAQLVMYSMTATLAGRYTDFSSPWARQYCGCSQTSTT